MENTTEQIVSYLTQGLEEANQILYLLGKSSLAERIKFLIRRLWKQNKTISLYRSNSDKAVFLFCLNLYKIKKV